MNTFELIKNYINEHVPNPPESMTLDSKLSEIGVDSLHLLDLAFELEEKYGVCLAENIQKPETIGHLIALIEEHKPAPVNE
jgi:acyl carrier protein